MEKKHNLWSSSCQTKAFLLKMPPLRALLATCTYMQPRHVPMIVLLHACVAQYLMFNAGLACTPRAPFFKRKIPKRLLFLLLPMCFNARDSTCKPGQPCGNWWEYTEYVTLERLHLDIPPQSCAGLTLTRTIWTWPRGHLVSSKHLSLHTFSFNGREMDNLKPSETSSLHNSDAANGWFSDLHWLGSVVKNINKNPTRSGIQLEMPTGKVPANYPRKLLMSWGWKGKKILILAH